MAHSTQLNVTTINQQANRHDEMGADVNRQLDLVKAHVEATLAASTSEATRALSLTCDNWVESMRKNVLKHLAGMAENMRREANNQEALDSTHMQEILNIPLETGNFLSGVN